MGITSSIEKAAFHPPSPYHAQRTLVTDSHLGYSITSLDHKISHLTFDRRSDARDITILFSHGNAEDLGHSYGFFEEMARELKCRVVAYDYSGYGLSEGPCSEESAIASGNAAFEFVTKELRAPRSTIVLCGRSLGTGPSIDIAARERGLGGLILLSPLASCAAVAGNFLATVASPFDIFKNASKIGAVVDYPVLIYHGICDEVIHVGHGQKLYRKLLEAGNRAVFSRWVEGARHNDVEHVMRSEYWSIMNQFLHRVVDSRAVVPSDGSGEIEATCSSLGSMCS